ncbi:glycosyltransferase [Telmatobacter bradus]|uniref:glycosyltransferase n=1 Tax=Telmatobacter bradus TaxID=474953 RepID=UPI003B42B3D3
MITLFVAGGALAAWIYLTGFHGRFWQSGPELEPGASSGNARVAVVVPARDEAESITASLTSLLAQEYSGPLSVILVDDNSSDGTGAIARSLAQRELARNNRLTVLDGAPLAAGWSGKLWAVHQGLQHPAACAAEFILLTDADITHEPAHVAKLVAKAEADGRDMVSEMVRLHCDTGAERALIPAFIFFFQMLYPFAWVNDAKRSMAGAAGGTILIRRTALERIGGVESIRRELIDDCALARAVKKTGGSLWLGHADRTVSERIYADWREVWDMIARTAYVQLNHSPLLLAGCALGMALLYLAAPLLTFAAHGPAHWLALSAWLLMALSFQPTLRRYHRSPLWGLALPAIGLFYLCATVTSALRHYAGRGGGWKNRVYPQ